ncbi:hypothetical protein J2X77_000625 [Sphingobacterium sp. 2149]|nr:transposase [Sphingobacterium sp. 2149]MDR6733780.1 hypothetical protein [Sphingobacterium sp. 2149]
MTHLACWAHARREFEKALENDRPRAEKALLMIQQLYTIERKAKQDNLSPEKIKELRLEGSLPIINDLGKWIFEETKNTLPKSHFRKGVAFSMLLFIGVFKIHSLLMKTHYLLD